MKTPKIDRSATSTGRRAAIVFVAGALALGLGITGVRAALDGGESSQPTEPDRAASTSAQSAAGKPVTSTPTHSDAPSVVTTPSPASEPTQPTPDPTALADGVYPTFVRGVDVQGATITVDVLQVFVGTDALRAAVEDGLSWADVRYAPVYIRNENPLLRTLPVARDANIRFIGGCDASSREVGLTQLRQDSTPYTETFYYDLSIDHGRVVGIDQKIAIAAC